MRCYNNEDTFACIITDVLAYTQHIIVVKDGAEVIMKSFSGVQVVNYPNNADKGLVLRNTFNMLQIRVVNFYTA